MNREQQGQLNHIIDALAADLYHPLGGIAFTGFRAEAEMTLEQAIAHDRVPMPEGFVWGKPREYAWMFAEITLPESAAGERIVMSLQPGGESTVFLDGKPFGTKRAEWVAHPHHHIVDQTVSYRAVPGEKHALALEVYGGTPLPAHAGRPIFPEIGVAWENDEMPTVGKSTFGLWNEEAYQLWLDLTMLRDISGFLDENDAMKEQIGHCIGKMLDMLDLEQPLPQRRQTCKDARAVLAPVMAAHNGTFAPSMGVIGNSHLDLAWLWPMTETRRKTARTFAAQLRLLREYPEALFLASQCAEYELCREHYPELFEEIKAAIREGRWIAEGGMWVEPDTNLSGGEALVRQFLYGKKYFKEVLGVDSQVAWLPDTFGYSAALPQIIKGFGMKGLTTQKIFWSYNDSEPFPHHAFRWKGNDGTEILSFLHMAYETKVDAATLHTRWNARVEKDGSGDFYLPFGYGDGGGGPTRDDMEQIRRQKDLQGSPRLYWMDPGAYLGKRNDGSLPVFRGELYFPCHRGTYTTQAAVKKGNRRCENAMRLWEMLAAFASFTGGEDYPAADLERVWKDLLVHQFHDILPGSSIGAVYEETHTAHARILKSAVLGASTALLALTDKRDDAGTAFFNGATHGGKRLIEADASFAEGAMDECGHLLPAQPWQGGALIWADVPALGAVSLRPAKAPKMNEASVSESEDGYRFRNGQLEAFISREGELLSFRANGKERVRSASNRFHLYRDLPRIFDAWDIDSQTEDREIFPPRATASRIVCEQGLRAAVRFRTALDTSVIEQTISMDAGAMQIEFDTKVLWNERHRLLKVSFDTGLDVPEAQHQIQFGHLSRPAHRSRQYDADRFEVCCHAWTALHDATHGAALLNDCKYGVGVCDGVIGLSLLRAPTYPDPKADQGEHTFRYAYRVWDGPFEGAGLNEAAEALNVPLLAIPGRAGFGPLFRLDDPAVTVESVKLAEDGSGDLILRLYEAQNGCRDVALTPPAKIEKAWECDLAENKQRRVGTENGAFRLSFRPFEIKTLRLR